MSNEIVVGGQAVINGIMMRAGESIAISVRKNNKKIVSTTTAIKKRSKFLSLPFIRGVTNLIDMMRLGLHAIVWSSNQSFDEEEELTKKEISLTFLFSFIITAIFFVGLPFLLTKYITKTSTGLWFNTLDGFIRVGFFIAYLLLVSNLKDMRTIFQYHGAEHKTVYCFEAKKKLTVNNIKKYTRFHPRCGTSFIALVLIITIAIFSAIKTTNTFLNIGSRILLIPLVASVSYELLKFTAKHVENWFVRPIVIPGLLLQRITTREPTNSQIEVAIHSLNLALKNKKKLKGNFII